MSLFCSFCSEPITRETTKCPSCDQIYSPDTLSFIALCQKAAKGHPHNHRKQIRFPVKLSITYSAINAYAHTYTLDVSLGGFSVETHFPLNSGDRLNVRLPFPGKIDSLNSSGEMVWSQEQKQTTPTAGGRTLSKMGVKFLDHSDNDKEKLICILNRALA